MYVSPLVPYITVSPANTGPMSAAQMRAVPIVATVVCASVLRERMSAAFSNVLKFVFAIFSSPSCIVMLAPPKRGVYAEG